MQKIERDRVFKRISSNQKLYLVCIEQEKQMKNLEGRFINLRHKFRRFLRAEYASNNSLKQIPRLVAIIFGLQEDIRQLNLTQYDFEEEKRILNIYLKRAIQSLIYTKYNGKCASYGETLLNCYLDLFITVTVLKTEKEIGAHPLFMRYPLTGSNLELDVLFEGFKLAFEFQGEHHYTDIRVSRKDSFKLNECAHNDRVLIPVNISQLSQSQLSILIINSIKEQRGLVHIFENPDLEKVESNIISRRKMFSFFKIIQRVYLAEILFQETLQWLDGKASRYIHKQQARSPISANTVAPRLQHIGIDLDVQTMYRAIPLIKRKYM